MLDTSIEVEVVTGRAASVWLSDVAALRIAVFRDWPYLYAGNRDYEQAYLEAYAASARSVFVLALAGERLVGASTGLPLADDAAAFQAPFLARGIDPRTVFYFGESVLLPGFRGRGLGHAFFDRREAHARTLGGFSLTAFAAVDRDQDDPRRPPAHRGHEAFWTGRGYARQAGMSMQLDWDDVDAGSCTHALTFWTRPLEHRP